MKKTTCFLVFPHQLFADIEKHAGGDLATFILWDDPVFYGDRRGSPHGAAQLRLNPLRIAYANAAVTAFLAAHPRIRHVTTESLTALPLSRRYATLSDYDRVVALDPVDVLLEARLARARVPVTYLDSPAFLLTRAEIAAYSERVRDHTRLQQGQFYAYLKATVTPGLGPIADIASQDTANRAPFPRKATPPALPGPAIDPATGAATTPTAARAWLARFLRDRFALFGPYEDAVVAESPWMYHSGLSVFLNFGLLTPREVLDAVAAHVRSLPAAEQRRPEIVASYEGFVRQLAGWREYARFYYRHVPPAKYTKNVFNLRRAPGNRPPPAWYRGTTGLPTVDAAITDAFRDGYLHHIRRLMVVSNAMTLSGVHPDAVFTWMYEFALDSWDWVMVFNVYGMGTWSDGGVGMRKPYISGPGYLHRMVRDGLSKEEAAEWDRLFKAFLVAHADTLEHTQLAGVVRKAVAAATATATNQ